MISAVIATYNRAATLARSIRSVLVQEDLKELIIIDDGSKDETAHIVASFSDPRIVYHRLDTNTGASFARNRGIALAKGDYIMVWDSDDVLYPHAFARIMEEFRRDPSLAVVSAPARTLIAGAEMPFSRVPAGVVTIQDILCKKIPSNEKIRVARAGIMKDVSYKAKHIDFLVNVELIEHGTWYHIDEYLGDVINDPSVGSLTAARNKKSARGSIERAPHLAGFLDRHKDLLLRTSPHRYADYAYGAAIGFLLAGDTKKAHTFAWDAWRYHPGKIRYLALLKLSWLPWGTKILHMFYTD